MNQKFLQYRKKTFRFRLQLRITIIFSTKEFNFYYIWMDWYLQNLYLFQMITTKSLNHKLIIIKKYNNGYTPLYKLTQCRILSEAEGLGKYKLYLNLHFKLLVWE